MSKVKKILRALGNIQWYAGIVCMLIIVICVTAGVVSRKLLNHPLSWVEELCTLMFIYLAFFGASVAAMNGKHVSADFLTQKFSESGKKKLFVIQRIIMLILLACMAVSSIVVFPKMLGHSSTNLDISRSAYFIPIMFSSIYMFLVYFVELISALTGGKEQ